MKLPVCSPQHRRTQHSVSINNIAIAPRWNFAHLGAFSSGIRPAIRSHRMTTGNLFDNLGSVGWAFLLIELVFLLAAVAVGVNFNKMGKRVAGFVYVMILLLPWLAATTFWLFFGGSENLNSNSSFSVAAQIFVLTSFYSLLALPLMVGLMYVSKKSLGDPAP